MVIAMMLPLAAAGAEQIAADSLWSRRRRAVVEYLVAYLAMWSPFGLVATSLVTTIWPAGAPAAVAVVLLLAAAMWQVTPIRKRALRRCGSQARIRVRGWRADADCTAAGVAASRPCLVACAPVMAVMAVAHSAVTMAVLTVLLLNERRRGPNPAQRAGRPLEATSLVLLAAAVGISDFVLHHRLP